MNTTKVDLSGLAGPVFSGRNRGIQAREKCPECKFKCKCGWPFKEVAKNECMTTTNNTIHYFFCVNFPRGGSVGILPAYFFSLHSHAEVTSALRRLRLRRVV